MDSAANDLFVSDIICTFLNHKKFLSAVLPFTAETLLVADCYPFMSSGKVKLCHFLETVAGPCRLHNFIAHTVPYVDTRVLHDVSCGGAIVLSNLFSLMILLGG